MPSADLFIGLMSGTSLDGVDAVLASFSSDRIKVLAHVSAPMPADLRDEFLLLNAIGENELHRSALAANALTRLYANATRQLLLESSTKPSEVRAIGAHGQTVRHKPGFFDGIGYTLQINNPSLLAELTGITVVADFRSRDVAAGGQGAPLVPPFHRAVFGRANEDVAVLNIGGISNLTLLPSTESDKNLLGFDCGPGNALMDEWCMRHTAKSFDAGGAWAAAGKVNSGLLEKMRAEPFFAMDAPKSTGRDLFNAGWLQKQLADFSSVSPVDVQTTLTELTSWVNSNHLMRYMPTCSRLIVCGGGSQNSYLMERLQATLPHCKVLNSESEGMPPEQVEAAAFAWLARQTLLGKTSSVESVTGARGARILGGIYPA